MKSKNYLLFQLTQSFLLFSLIYCEIVEIDDGKIEGTIFMTRSGQSFNAFMRIPFAEPPLRELRFQPPRANKPWSGTLLGTTYGPICMQNSSLNMHEDCLQLNVFTKNLPLKDNTMLKPVIIYYHGGAWEAGSGVYASPILLMDRDILLVTTNYRLGAFGFLATGTSDAVGNAGLKDQVLALKWVKKNIIKFGGDPDRITIAGYSAGAQSVAALVVSPMSRGTFNGAIAMSGSITWQKKLETNQLGVAEKLAEKLNCTKSTIPSMVKCLKEKSATDIAIVHMNDILECPVLTWLPVIEPDVGQERFFSEQPEETIKKANFVAPPIITGVTSNEFIRPVPDVLGNSELLKRFNENFGEISPKCSFYETGTEISRQLSEALRKYYFPFDTIDVRSFDGLNRLFSDGTIGYGVHKFVHLMSNLTDVYYYKFSYIGRFSVFNYPNDKPYGVSHADDLMYIMPGPVITPSDPEYIMVERMTRIWEQFAWTGNPNNKTKEYLEEMNWPKHSYETEYYLEIGTHLVEKNGLFLERYAIWDNVQLSSAAVMGLNVFLILVFIIIQVY